jgi:hypothetical protein
MPTWLVTVLIVVTYVASAVARSDKRFNHLEANSKEQRRPITRRKTRRAGECPSCRGRAFSDCEIPALTVGDTGQIGGLDR